jgi:hypothetical protein
MSAALRESLERRTFDLSAIAPSKQHWWTTHFASRILIDGTGIIVEYPNSKTRMLRWDDPDLAFYLVDYRAPVARHDRWSTPAQAKRTPFSFCPGSFSSPTRAMPIWTTEAAYQALKDSGFAMRLHVSNGMGRGYAHDAVVTVFARKRYSLWAVAELNPNAE